MSAIHSSVLDTIGKTPVVRIGRIGPTGVEIHAKLESFNPMGSVKDRLAYAIIEAAERDGRLRPGQTVVEATSGNTGISLAMVCAQRGYPLVIVMAESFSIERRKLMRFLGAKVVLTPASEKGTGMVAKARELAEKHGWFLANQFENPANAAIHERTTAEEILAAFGPNGLDYWVSGFGSSGTLLGVGRTLRAKSPKTRIIACEPDNSAMLSSGIPQPENGSHPAFRPHLMQGWAPDFLPPLVRKAQEEGIIDAVMPVSGGDALETARALATMEGIFCGPTSGATMAAAIAVARTAPEGSKILAMLPDTGERYLSTPLFADIPVAMTEEELEISASTDGYRFDRPSAPAPAEAPSIPVASEAALDHVDAIVRNPENRVVMFALEWCEFSWSVRRLFAEMGIEYTSVDLDGPAYRKDGWSTEVRKALHVRTGAPTIPQVFVGGRHAGGATDVLDAVKSGLFASLLEEADMPPPHMMPADPYAFLPGWLQPR